MDMQDKEFDDLFRAKLEGFETEPTGNVWPGIADGLDAAKRVRSRATWLSIAASVLVLAGISVLFVSRQSHNSIQTANTVAGAKTQALAVKAVPAVVKRRPAISQTSSQVATVKPVHAQKLISSNNISQNIKTADTTIAQPAAVKKDGPQWIADVPQKQPATIKAVVPDQALQLTVKSSISQLPGAQKMVNSLADNTADTMAAKSKHKIHSFGDLVNLVVDKVDKRKDKAIEFTDDGDGDSNITGVNLGIVKIKKGE